MNNKFIKKIFFILDALSKILFHICLFSGTITILYEIIKLLDLNHQYDYFYGTLCGVITAIFIFFSHKLL